MRNYKFVLFAILLSLTSFIQAQIAPVDDHGIAVGGYDVVAYFSGEAEKGFDSYSTEYKGATYQFSTKENLKVFQKNATQYLPQFDGYCAWGVAAQKAKFPINPETFDIVDGKLYLFFNGPFKEDKFNSLEPWSAETTKLMTEAHQNWNEVKNAN